MFYPQPVISYIRVYTHIPKTNTKTLKHHNYLKNKNTK